jgi:hypothetical protein
VRRRSNADHLPERFDEALAAVIEFADPICPSLMRKPEAPSSSHDVRECDKRGEPHRTAERGEDQERSCWHMQSAAQDCYYIKRRHTGDATRGDCCNREDPSEQLRHVLRIAVESIERRSGSRSKAMPFQPYGQRSQARRAGRASPSEPLRGARADRARSAKRAARSRP